MTTEQVNQIGNCTNSQRNANINYVPSVTLDPINQQNSSVGGFGERLLRNKEFNWLTLWNVRVRLLLPPSFIKSTPFYCFLSHGYADLGSIWLAAEFNQIASSLLRLYFLRTTRIFTNKSSVCYILCNVGLILLPLLLRDGNIGFYTFYLDNLAGCPYHTFRHSFSGSTAAASLP